MWGPGADAVTRANLGHHPFRGYLAAATQNLAWGIAKATDSYNRDGERRPYDSLYSCCNTLRFLGHLGRARQAGN